MSDADARNGGVADVARELLHQDPGGQPPFTSAGWSLLTSKTAPSMEAATLGERVWGLALAYRCLNYLYPYVDRFKAPLADAHATAVAVLLQQGYEPAVRVLLDKAIAGCAADRVDEICSLGKTLRSWRTEILARHDTGASNGPTEGLNLCVKEVKRCGHGFRSFENYRLRALLHTGGVTWPARVHPPRIRTRTPRSNA